MVQPPVTEEALVPTRRYENLDPAQQLRLLDAARQEFSARGYVEASLNRIVAAAGISKGALYYYFEDKADLFVTVMRDVAADMVAALHLATLPDPGVDFWGFMAETTHRKLRYARQFPGLTRMTTELTRIAASPLAPPAFRAYMQEVMAQTEVFCRAGQAAGAFRNDLPCDTLVPLMTSVLETLTERMLQDLDSGSEAEIDRFAAIALDMTRRIAGPAPQEVLR